MPENERQILIVDPRPANRASLTALFETHSLPCTVISNPSEALKEIRARAPLALIVAPQLANFSGAALLALARGMRPRLDGLVVDQPERDKGLLENLARRVKALPPTVAP